MRITVGRKCSRSYQRDRHPTGFRDYSAIFYLNDDYEGGEINFPNFDLTIKPEKGSAVFFPAGFEHSHSVSEVKGKKRITIAVWYSWMCFMQNNGRQFKRT